MKAGMNQQQIITLKHWEMIEDMIQYGKCIESWINGDDGHITVEIMV